MFISLPLMEEKQLYKGHPPFWKFLPQFLEVLKQLTIVVHNLPLGEENSEYLSAIWVEE